jgi:hypothetical protein
LKRPILKCEKKRPLKSVFESQQKMLAKLSLTETETLTSLKVFEAFFPNRNRRKPRKASFEANSEWLRQGL